MWSKPCPKAQLLRRSVERLLGLEDLGPPLHDDEHLEYAAWDVIGPEIRYRRHETKTLIPEGRFEDCGSSLLDSHTQGLRHLGIGVISHDRTRRDVRHQGLYISASGRQDEDDVGLTEILWSIGEEDTVLALAGLVVARVQGDDRPELV
jgi:hypothetical protein